MMSVLTKFKSKPVAAEIVEEGQRERRPTTFDDATEAGIKSHPRVVAQLQQIRTVESQLADAESAYAKARKLRDACPDSRVSALQGQLLFLCGRPARIEALLQQADSAAQTGDAGELLALRNKLVEEMYTRPQFHDPDVSPYTERGKLDAAASRVAGDCTIIREQLAHEKTRGLETARWSAAEDILRQSSASLNAAERRARELKMKADREFALAKIEADRQDLIARNMRFTAITNYRITARHGG